MDDEAVRQWWLSLDDEARSWFEDAARAERADAEVVQRLSASKCPASLVGTKWESQPGFAFHWPDSLLAVVLPGDHI